MTTNTESATPTHVALHDIVDTAVAAGSFPGCVALVWRDGALLYHEAHGHFATHADGPERFRGVTRAAVYDLASLTKVIGTTSAMIQLVGSGRISVADAPAARLTASGVWRELARRTGDPVALPNRFIVIQHWFG